MLRSSHRLPRPFAALAVLAAASFLSLTTMAGPVSAADPLTMDAHALIGGHVRVGSWMAIEVDITNPGPPITGEIRLAGGSQGRTRFGVAVDLPTGSRQAHVLHVQPPAFGDKLDIALIGTDGRTILSKKVPFVLHDATQLLVGIVADRPDRIVEGFRIGGDKGALPPATAILAPEDLPERVEAWGALDRLIWQDVDTARLSPAQVAAMRGWLAGGGRLVVVGGTAGPSSLTGLPDEILPYRPTATIDAPAETLRSLLGAIPVDAVAVPALAGSAGEGRTLASVGDRVIAAERRYGNGAVALVGIDPTSSWIAASRASDGLWRSLVPGRSNGGDVSGSDDSYMVQAVASLPSLALPPIGGLIVLLFGYILLIGPINYLVLRRLDRREWAWLTMPVLIVGFAVGAYAFGSALRGGDVLINEVAVVRGAPGVEEGLGSVYVGIFSPNRGNFQVRVPGGALLSAPVSTELAGGPDAGAGALDLIQGDPARVRDLSIGFGSLRTLLAETPLAVPRLTSDLRLENGTLVGTITNQSTQKLQNVAIVLGGNAVVLGDLEPGANETVRLPMAENFQNFGQSLADRILGPVFFDGGPIGSEGQTAQVRHAVIDQLTFDPNFGPTGQLQADGPVLLGWTNGDPLPIEIVGQTPRRTGQTMYYVPLGMTVKGATVFTSDLVRTTVIASDAGFFNKGPFDMSFGQGSVTLAYRPIAFGGSLDATKVVLAMNTGPDAQPIGGGVDPVASPPLPAPGGPAPAFDGAPEIELFDRTTSSWARLPHIAGQAVSVNQPSRYVDPTTGTVLVRLSNERADGVGFQFFVRIEGNVR
ncbi:MAG: hypothetical protein M3P84_04695 [Chloroflexota bacterium]|nr:hypothetical protein [Chloroflexota bacterium]